MIERRRVPVLERHRASLEGVVTAATTLKDSVGEKKFAEGENEQAVQEWKNWKNRLTRRINACDN